MSNDESGTYDLEQSARDRANADYKLVGLNAENRQLMAQLRVKMLRKMGEPVDQWVLDVAEGRLPA